MPSARSALAPRTASLILAPCMIVNSLGQIAPNTVHDHGVALVSPRAEGYVAAQVREVGAEDDTVDSDDIAQQAQHQVTHRTLPIPVQVAE